MSTGLAYAEHYTTLMSRRSKVQSLFNHQGCLKLLTALVSVGRRPPTPDSNDSKNVHGISCKRAWPGCGSHEDRFAFGLRTVMNIVPDDHLPFEPIEKTPG